ncbi:hypothetical protein EQ831_23605 [Pseudomonas sp. ALS1279]|nr:hypothetical protein [Pseudomonas sp. ALS1279]TRO27448.1 hypothetical protein EQ831_23605 [Pseudomonas sp. ALS1279]
MARKIVLLVKVFDKEEYADAFIATGEMFCKTIGQFKRIEGDAARGDQFEAPWGWHQPDGISLRISYKTSGGEEKSFPIDDLAGPLVMQRAALDHLNAFCMYAVTIPDFEETYETEEERMRVVEKVNSMLKGHAKINEEMLSLGEHAVVIFEVENFIDKVSKAAKSEGYSIWGKLVDYFDPDSFDGSFGEIESLFKKRNIYSYQKEFRFVFDSGKPGVATTLHAGHLGKISFKVKTSEINSKFELKLAEDQPANGY